MPGGGMRHELEIISVCGAGGWWHVAPTGARQPLACWAMVAVPQSDAFVVGAVVGPDGTSVEMLEPGQGRYEYEGLDRGLIG